MTQYDAGPGDWSDREWEAPDFEQQPQTKRQRLTLPPWALLAILVAIVILLCVGLVLIVRAIRGGGAQETPTPEATSAFVVPPTATLSLDLPTAIPSQPSPTLVLPTESPTEPPPPAVVAPGVTVVVKGTGGTGLSLRAKPTTQSKRVAVIKDGTELTVLDGPEKANGYVWWKLRAPDGKEGWGVTKYLALNP